MLDGSSVVTAFKECGITHVVWLPDSELGTWEQALTSDADLALIRVCREGEAMAVAAGLILGGCRPVIAIQCTGLFEAGDSLRNIIHDMKLPIFMIVGLRSYNAYQQKKTSDTCPIFAEPILRAWQIQYTIFDHRQTAADLVQAYRQAQADNQAAVVCLAE